MKFKGRFYSLSLSRKPLVYVVLVLLVYCLLLPHSFFTDKALAADNKKVYIAIGVDTESSDKEVGLSINAYLAKHIHDFTNTDWVDPASHVGQVMDTSFRNQYPDANHNPFKITWLPETDSIMKNSVQNDYLWSFKDMLNLWGNKMNNYGDAQGLHYHFRDWSDRNGDGISYWNQLPTLSDNDYPDEALNYWISDLEKFPDTFHSGDRWENNQLSAWLENNVPFDINNYSPNASTGTIVEPIRSISDWSTASEEWYPYHPSVNNYQGVGDMKRSISKSSHTGEATQADLNQFFLTSQGLSLNNSDEHSPQITYTGVWTDTNPTGHSAKYALAAGRLAEFTFSGPVISWNSVKYTNGGIANVYIDNVLQESVDLYSATMVWEDVFTKTNLSDTNHTIKIEVTGTKNPASKNTVVHVDSFDTKGPAISATSPVVVITMHSYDDLPTYIAGFLTRVKKAIDTWGGEFEYTTIKEAFQKYYGYTDQTGPELSFSNEGSDYFISSSENLFQPAPIVVIKYRDGTLERQNMNTISNNYWGFNPSSGVSEIEKITAAATDLYGNVSIKSYTPIGDLPTIEELPVTGSERIPFQNCQILEPICYKVIFLGILLCNLVSSR